MRVCRQMLLSLSPFEIVKKMIREISESFIEEEEEIETDRHIDLTTSYRGS
jgi:hypothetical protein